MSHITWIIPDLPMLDKHTTDFPQDIPTALFHHLGGEGDLPRAALLALHHELPPANAWVLCEPVECMASKKDVVCLGNAHLTITLDTARAWVAKFNDYWEGTGRVMYAVSPSQWLLALPEPLSYRTQPLRKILNQPIPKQLPLLFSEAQMLMQGNTLNALWFSGEGELPVFDKRPDLHVMTNNPEAMALTRSVMGHVVPFCQSFDDFWAHYGKSQDEWIIALSAESLGATDEEEYVAMFEKHWLKSYLMHAKMPHDRNDSKTRSTNPTIDG